MDLLARNLNHRPHQISHRYPLITAQFDFGKV
jgi:hypothetical protein